MQRGETVVMNSAQNYKNPQAEILCWFKKSWLTVLQISIEYRNKMKTHNEQQRNRFTQDSQDVKQDSKRFAAIRATGCIFRARECRAVPQEPQVYQILSYLPPPEKH